MRTDSFACRDGKGRNKVSEMQKNKSVELQTRARADKPYQRVTARAYLGNEVGDRYASYKRR